MTVKLRLIIEPEPEEVPRQLYTFPATGDVTVAEALSFVNTGFSYIFYLENEPIFKQSTPGSSPPSNPLPGALPTCAINILSKRSLILHPNVLKSQGFVDRDKKSGDSKDAQVSLQELYSILETSTLPLNSILLFIIILYGGSIKLNWEKAGRWLDPKIPLSITLCHLIQLCEQTRWTHSLYYLCKLLRYVLIHTELPASTTDELTQIVGERSSSSLIGDMVWAHLLYYGANRILSYSGRIVKAPPTSDHWPHARLPPREKGLETKSTVGGIHYLSLASFKDPSRKIQIMPELCKDWPWLDGQLRNMPAGASENCLVLDLPLNTINEITQALVQYKSYPIASHSTIGDANEALLKGKAYGLFNELKLFTPGHPTSPSLPRSDIFRNIVQGYVELVFPKDRSQSMKRQLEAAHKLGLVVLLDAIIDHVADPKRYDWRKRLTTSDIQALPDDVSKKLLIALHRN